jgi:hypothetical protein
MRPTLVKIKPVRAWAYIEGGKMANMNGSYCIFSKKITAACIPVLIIIRPVRAKRGKHK